MAHALAAHAAMQTAIKHGRANPTRLPPLLADIRKHSATKHHDTIAAGGSKTRRGLHTRAKPARTTSGTNPRARPSCACPCPTDTPRPQPPQLTTHTSAALTTNELQTTTTPPPTPPWPARQRSYVAAPPQQAAARAAPRGSRPQSS